MLGQIAIDEIKESDLQNLITSGVPESERIDYKREFFTESENKNISKFVSSFANTHGGHLVFGMDEENGLPTELCGIQIEDVDEKKSTLSRMIRTCIEPVITGVNVEDVKLENGKYAIVIRIPKSWNLPHRVTVKGHNKFYIRHNTESIETRYEELKNLFHHGSSVQKQIQLFRDERIARISAGETHVPLASKYKLVLHIVPFSAYASNDVIDIDTVYLNHQCFHTICAYGLSSYYTLEGILNLSGNSSSSYTQIYRNGILESVCAYDLQGVKDFATSEEIVVFKELSFMSDVYREFDCYIRGLQKIGISPPLTVMLSLINFKNVWMEDRNNRRTDHTHRFKSNKILVPSININEFGNDYDDILKDMLDILWNAAGISECAKFEMHKKSFPKNTC